jgi:hypothetical protein
MGLTNPSGSLFAVGVQKTIMTVATVGPYLAATCKYEAPARWAHGMKCVAHITVETAQFAANMAAARLPEPKGEAGPLSQLGQLAHPAILVS